ncbi:PAAR domain-containing protein [Acinetobacter sp. C32I]|uniref:PAAR domain-containing protein n=1 Tax=Acinetobacter sp. C32I TaxID=2950074 RepID=UPI0020374642|nr:PAAR domain-containing protein [Acinetobacter sp. C32I]USA52867.1 PAAR domain-containing protein [Acinetobacter sp. C32I]
MRAFGVHGSTTNHGGFVQATQQRSSFNGQLFLRAGDGFFCPRCKCWSTLLKSNDHVIFDGIAVAFVGDLFSCSASLQPKQSHVIGDAGGAPCPSAFRAESSQRYSGQFQLINEDDQQPLANVKYVIELASGEKIQGTTDASGHTHKLNDTEQAEGISIRIEESDDHGY